MIRVAFIGLASKKWMGGLNYFRNLLYAIETFKKDEIEVIVFVGKKIDSEIKNIYTQYATVVEDSIFDKKSFKWYLMKVEQKIFDSNFFLSFVLNKYDIKVLSHANITNVINIKTINWIPDFQHLYFPHMFSNKEVEERNKKYKTIIEKSDAIVLSSYNSLRDFKNFTSKNKEKVRVLQFVSQPDRKYYELTEDHKKILFTKYNIQEDFFYIPNQFWKHKNHMIVFQAINELKKEGIVINLVCTGFMDDYRNKDYIQEIKYFIRSNSLSKNIKLLGLVDYEDVFKLIRFSKAVINPSLFEGWSSTVEECKSVNKNMILSDIDVHKEQYPEATFFQKENVESLKSILRDYHPNSISLSANLIARTKNFAETYLHTF